MELKLTASTAGRLSHFLQQELRMSNGLINRLKWKNLLFVNGNPVRTNHAVFPGDVITVVLDEPEPEYPAENGELTVLYEDEHLLAVDKPAGMLIHPSRSCYSGTLANFVAGYYQRTAQHCAFHPLTRLDRDTFGVVLLAKNAHVHNLLSSLHQQGRFCKTYHGLVFGGPQAQSGTIDAPIARLPLPSLLRHIHPDGKPSLTEFTVLKRGERYSQLALRPVTGRTHQLRVHCAYMGFPILGDPQYANAQSAALSRELGLSYQMLCAKHLTFPHPITGENMHIVSTLDVDFPEK